MPGRKVHELAKPCGSTATTTHRVAPTTVRDTLSARPRPTVAFPTPGAPDKTMTPCSGSASNDTAARR